MGSFGVVWFVWVRPCRRWVLLGSSGSFGCALRVAVFFPDHLVCPVATCGSLGSFGLIRIVQVRPVGLCVHSGSSDSSRYALVVAGFVLVRLVRPCAPWGSLRLFGLVWLIRLRTLGVSGFDRVRSGVVLGSLGWFGCVQFAVGVVRVCVVCPCVPLWTLGWFGFIWFMLVRPLVDWVRSGSCGTSVCVLMFSGFDWVRLVRPGAPWG